jgi:multiple sugar transport system ATP-binding protein
MAKLSLEGLTKVYANGVQALRGFDLEVADGEFVVLVGPSGCGKTTALRMVAGLEEISAGTLRIGDVVVNEVAPLQRDVAMVFQNYALYPHLSVSENIGFSLEMRNVPKRDREVKVREAAAILGLEELLTRKPRHLSGGQRQRVAMGRAIVRQPAVFLMDEPLSNLDAKLRVQMRAEVLRVQRRLGVATLYVTHDQTEAMTMGDRVAVLRDGVLQQVGRPQELYDHPANMFVASFIGSPAMNLYETTLVADGDGLAMRLGSQTVQLPEQLLNRLPELPAQRDRPLIVGIRPEHLLLPGDAPGADPLPGPSLEADVQLVEALGNELFVHFTLDVPRVGERERALSVDDAVGGDSSEDTGVARVPPRAAVRAGERTRFALDAAWLQFFDRDTGQALGGDPSAAAAVAAPAAAAPAGVGRPLPAPDASPELPA